VALPAPLTRRYRCDEIAWQRVLAMPHFDVYFLLNPPQPEAGSFLSMRIPLREGNFDWEFCMMDNYDNYDIIY
jgi:hypothetical protein